DSYTGTNSEKYDVDFVSNINKGKATVIITSKDNDYAVGGKTATFNIIARKLVAGDFKSESDS
ncbi:MAG: hypothetical protein J1E98_07305, partial [Lachnospiraceae bacterium]|nr:hypothetical protein [Lachnospiraceae bacterium]